MGCCPITWVCGGCGVLSHHLGVRRVWGVVPSFGCVEGVGYCPIIWVCGGWKVWVLSITRCVEC